MVSHHLTQTLSWEERAAIGVSRHSKTLEPIPQAAPELVVLVALLAAGLLMGEAEDALAERRPDEAGEGANVVPISPADEGIEPQSRRPVIGEQPLDVAPDGGIGPLRAVGH